MSDKPIAQLKPPKLKTSIHKMSNSKPLMLKASRSKAARLKGLSLSLRSRPRLLFHPLGRRNHATSVHYQPSNPKPPKK